MDIINLSASPGLVSTESAQLTAKTKMGYYFLYKGVCRSGRVLNLKTPGKMNEQEPVCGPTGCRPRPREHKIAP
jgi:hypothetical protein